MSSAPDAIAAHQHVSLTGDGALALTVDADLADAVAAWLPSHLRLSARASAAVPEARIVARRGAGPASASSNVAGTGAPRGPDLVAGNVALWREGDAMRLQTLGARGPAGVVELAARHAVLTVPGGHGADAPEVTAALHTMLLLASAYLLGRLGRALVHGASLVAPDGRAWLLVGDTHAGKTTTCATLVDAGWQYCADDHAILQPTPAGVVVEGWPRLFHLDGGWDHGVPVGGARRDVDAFVRWPGRWRPAAPLAGVLCPRVDADAATALAPLEPTGRLSALLRQSPWLTADPGAAPALLALLQRVAARPGAALRLGRDTFRRPEPLAAVLAPLTAPA